MAAHFNNNKLLTVRLGSWLSLIFFACILIVSCKSDFRVKKSHDNDEVFSVYADNKSDIVFGYVTDKVKSLSIPHHLLSKEPGSFSADKPDLVKRDIGIVLKSTTGHDNRIGVPMLGDVDVTVKDIVFTPVVPFTAGHSYLIFYQDRLIREVTVPLPDAQSAPAITAIYPSTDTLPENVLKLYVLFSGPMREGEALDHIKLIPETGDTLTGTFLNLQPELWNEASDVLTIWFDPGRIKRDLIPNREKGNPLTRRQHYTLVIDSAWAGANGLTLQQTFRKKFFVTARDSTSPKPENWRYSAPLAATFDPFTVSFPESLDYFLLQESLTILDASLKPVAGTFRVMPEERAVKFMPNEKWQPGQFRLRITSVLEDLAGNNLNRPFERDNLRHEVTSTRQFYEMPFSVSPVLQVSNP
jgi:hypothetical protein